MEIEHLYVLAKSLPEYEHFRALNNLSPQHTHYISAGGSILLGVRGARIVYYGDYMNRPDYLDIAEIIRTRQMVDVTKQYEH